MFMDQRFGMICSSLGVILMVATFLYQSETDGAQDKPTVYKTPQESFEAIKQAMVKNDRVAFFGYPPLIKNWKDKHPPQLSRIAVGHERELESRTLVCSFRSKTDGRAALVEPASAGT